MEPLVTAQQMRECDRIALKTAGVPGVVLMENAGRAAAAAAARFLGGVRGKRIVVFCGTGNNGGDGLVAARHLLQRGAEVSVALVGSGSRVRGDAKTNMHILRKLARGGTGIFVETESVKAVARLGAPQLIIDGLFGTGFSGAVRNPYRKIIEWINTQRIPVLSIDIPSGLNADNGRVENVGVKADLTVTMGFRKIGLLTGRGPEHAGRIEVEGLGVPASIFAGKVSSCFLVDEYDVRQLLPMRAFDAHKHSVGKIFVLAGSRGLTGAAAMVSLAAMRTGAGAVVLGTPESVYPLLAKKLTEVMVEPLGETDAGSLSLAAMHSIEKHANWADVVVLGPGLSRHSETQQLARSVMERIDRPLLIDADGLNALVNNLSVLRKRRKSSTILTPHTGELARLSGLTSDGIELDRVATARSFAEQVHAIVVLKGAPTVTANEEGNVFVNSTGNPGMATAGSGDVLAGVIAALWAQNLPAQDAAFCGVYVHGRAGDIARDRFGERAMMALDILANTGEALKGISPSGDK